MAAIIAYRARAILASQSHAQQGVSWAQPIWFPHRSYSSKNEEDTTTPVAAAAASNKSLEDFFYIGPFSTPVGRVKKLSLFSLACALSACPVIIALDGGANLNAKLSIAATLGGFGAFTTGLLHWFTHPYVHKLHYKSSNDTIEVETLNFLAKPQTRQFTLGQVEVANTMHPLSSFSVDGKNYHIDADYFNNKDLLVKLVGAPPEPQVQEEQQE